MRGVFLLILFSLFSVSNAQSWRQCWGQEYIYYDSKCCENQEKIADEQFHCLDSIPTVSNYSELQTNLHSQLDALETCTKNSTIKGQDSLVLKNELYMCTNYDHAVMVADITEAACHAHLLQIKTVGKHCKGTSNHVMAYTEAACLALSNTNQWVDLPEVSIANYRPT